MRPHGVKGRTDGRGPSFDISTTIRKKSACEDSKGVATETGGCGVMGTKSPQEISLYPKVIAAHFLTLLLKNRDKPPSSNMIGCHRDIIGVCSREWRSPECFP